MAKLEKILLATDGSNATESASEQAIDLAAQTGACLLVVSVIGHSARSTEAATGAAPAESRDDLTAAAQNLVGRARAAGLTATFLVWDGEPGDAIVAAANAENADLIIVGSHGRSGVSRFFIGSVSDYVVRHARCPVMVVRGGPERSRR